MNKSRRKFPPSIYFSIIGQKGLGTKARTSAPKMCFTIARINPPASEESREVANLTERKNTHTPYMVSKNLSVCPSLTLN